MIQQQPPRESDQPNGRARWNWLRRFAGIGMMAIAAIYVAHTLEEGITQIEPTQLALSPSGFLALVLGCTGTLILSTVYHVIEVRRLEPHNLTHARVALAYSLGQVVRYIPGKVFGILFHIRFVADRLRASTIAIALLIQTAYDYFWTFVLSAAILLAVRGSSLAPLLGTLPALALVWLIHRKGYFEAILRTTTRFGSGSRPPQAPSTDRLAGPATVVIGLVWLPLLLGVVLGLSSQYGYQSALVMGALYISAAVLSLLAIVVPSGLVVREAIFVWLGVQLELQPDTLLAVSVVLRVALTLGELLCLALVALFDRMTRARSPISPVSVGGRHDQ